MIKENYSRNKRKFKAIPGGTGTRPVFFSFRCARIRRHFDQDGRHERHLLAPARQEEKPLITGGQSASILENAEEP
jgi:hypothetical protein